MYHDINQILSLTKKFRTAIDKAYSNGDFNDDFSFRRFPHGCCGATCYVLAKYFKEKGVDTIYVSSENKYGSHAWLVIKDDRVQAPSYIMNTDACDFELVISIGDEKRYYNFKNDGSKKAAEYQYCDLEEGIIVDITADQFDESPIFVGYIDDFHKKYEFDSAHESNYELTDVDLNRYSIIEKYL